MNDNLSDIKEYKKYKYKLTPFKLCVLQNFPFIEADFDAITNYQLLCKVVEYLNHVIDNQNTVEDNFKIMVDNLNTLYNFLDTLDLQDEVNNKLDEMVTDGTLENIIQNIFNKNNGSLVASLFYRDCTEFINGVTSESQSQPIKGFFQGMTTTPTSIIFVIIPAGSYENKLNYAYLVEISKSTKTILKEAYLQIYHANSIAYNDSLKEIYVACNSYVNEAEQTVNFNQIITIDYNTFTIKEIPTLSDDIINNLNGSHIMGVSYDNKNNVLSVSSQNKLFILDDFETVTDIININYDNTAPITNEIFNNQTNQQIKLFDNKIYQTRLFGNGLVIYDMNGNVIQNYYQFDIDIPVHLGEVEAFEIEEDGTLYFSSVQRSWQGTIYSFYDRTIFKSNIIRNGYKNFKKISNSLNSGNTLYVDVTTTNNLQVGTSNYPFKSITQALLTSEFNENIPSYIQCVSSGNYGIIINRLSKFISINGNSNATFIGLICQGCNTTISNSNFNLENDLTLISDNKNIVIENSKVYFNTCNFLGNENTPNNYAIYNTISDINIRNSSFSNFINALYNGFNSNLYLTGLTFTNVTYKYYNSHNIINIFTDNNSIYSDSNPNGLLSFTPRSQLIENETDGNKLIFDEKVYERINIINLAYKITLGNTNLYFSDTIRKGSARLTHYCYTDKEWLIDITVSSNDTGHYLNLTPKVLQRQNDGTLTNVTSNCTFAWYRCYNIY